MITGYFQTTAARTGGAYDMYVVRDTSDRQWKLVSDSSIRLQSSSGGRTSSEYAVEFVSQICMYEDIETIQELIRKLRAAGAMVNSFCGIHVHVDASTHTVQTLHNIVNIMAAKGTNEKYTFRTWLLRLGLIGDEFKTARHHLLKNLEGNIAWRDPSQAQAQKERMAAKRALETEDRNVITEEAVIGIIDEDEEQEQSHGLTMSM